MVVDNENDVMGEENAGQLIEVNLIIYRWIMVSQLIRLRFIWELIGGNKKLPIWVFNQLKAIFGVSILLEFKENWIICKAPFEINVSL